MHAVPRWTLTLALLTAFTARAQTEWLPLLDYANTAAPTLRDSVETLLGQDSALDTDPSVVLITYRQRGPAVRDLVVQLYQQSPSAHPILNPHGTVRERIGNELADSTDRLLALLSRPAVFRGAERDARRLRRAFDAGFNGDLTLLREQTVEPLQVVALLPDASWLLPKSLAGRVRSIVLEADLHFAVWRGRVGLVTDDAGDAEQIGNIIAAWREMAAALAQTYAGYTSGDKLRASIQSTDVRVVESRVVASAEIPAMTMVRVAKEAAGHGGGCPSGPPCPPDRVAVCHLEPGKPQRTLCLPAAAVSAHLAHGDACGPCATE